MRRSSLFSAVPFAVVLASQSLGVCTIFADQPPANYEVVPIPLDFDEEESAAESPATTNRLPPDASITPRDQVAAPSLELAPPMRVDPFAQPGFDPFDDDQFAPYQPQTLPSKPGPADQKRPTLKPTEIQPIDDSPRPVQSAPPVAATGREMIRERYANSAVKIEREMLQDASGNYVLDGIWRWFTPKGALIAQGEYVQDQRQGVWQRTYAGTEEPLFKSAPYNQFQAPFHSEATFQQGKLHGPWTIYDAQQRKVSEIFFENGQRHGPAMWWNVRATPVIQAQFERGVIHGESFVFDGNGKIVRRDHYEQGWKHERRTDKYPTGKVKEEAQWLGGKWKLTSEDDWWNARIATFEFEAEPVRHGKQVSYFPNGQIQRQREFDRGQPVGDVISWHENGQRASLGHFNQQGQPDGAWTWWHNNGLRSVAGDYLAGSAQGDWTWWNAEGKISRRGALTEVPTEIIATSPGAATLGRPRPVE